MQQIFNLKKLPLWLKTYEILATGPNCGLIDYINDAMSLDEIHKRTDNQSLYDFYVDSYGHKNKKSRGFRRA
jgi:phosphatidylinositol kinase/protein kinase (PI-3  family)